MGIELLPFWVIPNKVCSLQGARWASFLLELLLEQSSAVDWARRWGLGPLSGFATERVLDDHSTTEKSCIHHRRVLLLVERIPPRDQM